MKSRRSSRNIIVRGGSPSGTPKWMIPTIIASVVILFIAVIILFFGGARITSSKDLESLREQLHRLENRVVHLEGLARKSLQPSPMAEESTIEVNAEGRYHTVSPGDTLSGIAEQYGVLPPVRKSIVLADEKVPMVGRLGNTHLDILPFFPSGF